MSVITSITGVPLFTTIREAVAWATSRGMVGYHTHSFQNQIGYMGGASHAQVTRAPANSNTSLVTTPPRTNPLIRSRSNIMTSGGSGGGGGY